MAMGGASWGRRLGLLAMGLLAGLVAGLAMLALFGGLRLWLGIAPPVEMIPDRLAPTLSVDRFIDLVNQYGYNTLKATGIKAGLAGLIGAGAIVGILYALVAESAGARARGA